MISIREKHSIKESRNTEHWEKSRRVLKGKTWMVFGDHVLSPLGFLVEIEIEKNWKKTKSNDVQKNSEEEQQVERKK